MKNHATRSMARCYCSSRTRLPWSPPTAIAWPWLKSTTNSTGLTREVRPLVPKKALTEVQRLAIEAGEDGEIEFALDESHLFFRVGERLLISRMLTGQFPNYEAVLPRENNKHVVIERNELNDAVKRVAQLADTALARRETFRHQGRRRNFRVQPGIWRSKGNSRKGIQRRAHSHRIQCAIHAGFSCRCRRRPDQPGIKRRTIGGSNAPPRRRGLPLPLHHHADADLSESLLKNKTIFALNLSLQVFVYRNTSKYLYY